MKNENQNNHAIMTTLKISLVALLSLNACVTTRSQLGQAGKTGQDTSHHAPTVESYPSSPMPGPYVPTKATFDVDDLKSEVSKLLGRVDELEQKLSQTSNHAEMIKSLQTKVEELEKRSPVAASTPAFVPEVKDHYQLGKKAYQSSKFEDAIVAFEEVQKNPDSKNLEEAIFLEGESFFKLKNFRKAIVEFSKITEKYPKSSNHPKALLRIAESFEALGSKEDAEAFYSEIIEKFSKSAEAKAAKKRLKKK